MENLHRLFIPSYGSSDDILYDETLRSIYDDDPILKHFSHIEHRKSIVSIVDTAEALEPDFEIRGNLLSRRSSLAISRSNSAIPQSLMASSFHSTDAGTLDHVANVAAHHDTVYSYHYIDETDKTVSLWHVWIYAGSFGLKDFYFVLKNMKNEFRFLNFFRLATFPPP